MRIFFGVLRGGPGPQEAFDALLRTTAASNPEAAIRVETAGYASIGSVSRSLAVLDDPQADRAIYLEGEVLSIDGLATTSRGASVEELRSISTLFETSGNRFWDRIDGSFCLVIRDGSVWHIGVDVSGTRAVYWWFADGTFAFHSHLIDLAPTYPGRAATDLGAIGNFLASGMYPPDHTAFNGVHHLGAGQHATVSRGRIEAHDYFRMAYADDPPVRPMERIVDELIELLANSIGSSLRAARHPVVPLSGGTDSRYIAAEIARQAPHLEDVQTITWGEDRARIGSDAVVSTQVAGALGVRNEWYEKPQRHTSESFWRAIYLSSGEADHAIHYPDDHLLNVALARKGYESIFRGDEMFGPNHANVTTRAAFAANAIIRLSVVSGYDGLLDRDLLTQMSSGQSAILETIDHAVRSRSPMGRRNEIHYLFGIRRVLAAYNAVKVFDLEVYTPLIQRDILDWLASLPERFRYGKDLLKAATLRRFPSLAAIPYASRSNLPAWDRVWRRDPHLALVLREAFASPGWLDSIGAGRTVASRLGLFETAVDRHRHPVADSAAAPGVTAARLRDLARQTPPGRLIRELTLERRAAAAMPVYLTFARMAVVHLLIGRVEQRRSALGSSSSLPL